MKKHLFWLTFITQTLRRNKFKFLWVQSVTKCFLFRFWEKNNTCRGFQLIFWSSLEASGGMPALKKKSISKLMQIFEQNNLVDIWRIHNPTLKQYTFRKHNLSRFSVLEYFKKGNILPSFCSDYSPISYILESSSQKYVTQMKQHKTKVQPCFWKQGSYSGGIFKIRNSEIFYRILMK